MIWITTGTDYGTGDMKRSEVVATEAHKDHPDKVGYSEFNWYFNLDSSGPLLKNTPFTIVENANIKYKIIYNTNGGSPIAEEKQTSLPDPLPAATKDGYEFAGWYTDADFYDDCAAGTGTYCRHDSLCKMGRTQAHIQE